MQIKPPKADDGKYKPFMSVDAPVGDWVHKDESGYYFELAFTDGKFKVYIARIESGDSKK